MADRRFTIQTEPRGVNTMKTTAPSNVVRDDLQAPLTNSGPSLAIAATAAATVVPERRPSQAFYRRLSMSMGASRKSSMFPLHQINLDQIHIVWNQMMNIVFVHIKFKPKYLKN